TARQEPPGEDVGLDPTEHLDGREVVAVDVPSAASGGLVRTLTLVHRWPTLALMKLPAPEGGGSRILVGRRFVATGSRVARSDALALYGLALGQLTLVEVDE
ncbi:MAG: hypothetical protein QOI00_1, partial [Chloroflexota bacterium]|nr:hypothetical protein [Chloroflexota bacterium]